VLEEVWPKLVIEVELDELEGLVQVQIAIFRLANADGTTYRKLT
jgi:hypothetical protein